jgi:hypothetical protein
MLQIEMARMLVLYKEALLFVPIEQTIVPNVCIFAYHEKNGGGNSANKEINRIGHEGFLKIREFYRSHA